MADGPTTTTSRRRINKQAIKKQKKEAKGEQDEDCFYLVICQKRKTLKKVRQKNVSKNINVCSFVCKNMILNKENILSHNKETTILTQRTLQQFYSLFPHKLFVLSQF